MEVAIVGSSGFIGRALTSALERSGMRVLRIVRRPAEGPDEHEWDGLHLPPRALKGIDAVVNLAGAGLGDKRWSPGYRKVLWDSRILTTDAVSRSAAHAQVSCLINASAIGYYGDRHDALLEETSSAGAGFLAELCQDWEAATEPARARCRVVNLRSGVVLGYGGGALDRQLRLFRMGMGAPLGSGKQWLSWISLTDHIAAIKHLLRTDVEGPVNLVSPNPVRNNDFTRVLGSVLHRPTSPLHVPQSVLHLAIGDLADEALGSQRALPGALSRSGYAWRHPTLPDTLRIALVKPQVPRRKVPA